MEDLVKSDRWRLGYSGRTVLVTGATGLVGSWLTDALVNAGARVIVLLRDDVPSSIAVTSGTLERAIRARGDLRSHFDLCRIVAEYEPDTVFHLGAQTQVGVGRRHPWGTLEANVRGTWNLLDALRLYGRAIRSVVVASSDKAYGDSSLLPYSESHPMAGVYPYDVSKSCVDLISRSYALTYGMPVGIARCGNIYGGGDLNFDRIVPGTIKAAYQDRRPVIRSDGQFVRDYIYVKDVVQAYLVLCAAVADQPEMRGEAFNFGYDRPVAVLDLVQCIMRLMDKTDLTPDIRDTATGEIRSQYLSSEKARRILDWVPSYDLESGLKETIGWYVPKMKAGLI